MAKQVFERFDGRELTDDMLQEAAELFNENYGVWGKDPTGKSPKPGKSSFDSYLPFLMRRQAVV
jgi:hypothetical protein